MKPKFHSNRYILRLWTHNIFMQIGDGRAENVFKNLMLCKWFIYFNVHTKSVDIFNNRFGLQLQDALPK